MMTGGIWSTAIDLVSPRRDVTNGLQPAYLCGVPWEQTASMAHQTDPLPKLVPLDLIRGFGC